MAGKKSRAGRIFPTKNTPHLDKAKLPSKRAKHLAQTAFTKMQHEGDLGLLYADFALSSLKEAEKVGGKGKKLNALFDAIGETNAASGHGSVAFNSEIGHVQTYIDDSIDKIMTGKDGALRSTAKVGENPVKVKINEKVNEILVSEGQPPYQNPLFSMYRSAPREKAIYGV
jgi:hypothetical protein